MTAIAERTFDVVDGGEIRVRVFQPEFRPTGDFGCEIEIAWPEPREPTRRTIYGIDALQALQLALRHLPALLEGSPESKAGRIRFQGSSELGLFPLL
ncbi:MAG: hypothetical protein Q8L23_05670 [Caulobacter sp.]|nr:hypothetical protein [Caulobacter sp.]